MTRGVSVVIPTVEREQSLRAALAAVARAASALDEPAEAIVVDDRLEPDRLDPVATLLDGLRVRRVYTADAGVKGPAAARNVGVAAAAYDLIAFTDDDARCDERWLAVGVGALRADPDLAGVEGAVRIDPDVPVDPVRSRIVVNERGGAYLTASLFARADAVRAVGGFRRLRSGGARWAIPYREDTDLGLRLVRDAGPVPFVPEAFVVHPAEPIDLRRLVRLGRYFIVDGAFARAHPGAVPPVWRAPLARARIRLATAITLLTPLLAARRTRAAAAFAIAVRTAAVSAQFEVELRSAGIDRTLAEAAGDTLRRLPRSLLWALAAGSARIEGEAIVVLRLPAPPADDARPANASSRPADAPEPS